METWLEAKESDTLDSPLSNEEVKNLPTSTVLLCVSKSLDRFVLASKLSRSEESSNMLVLEHGLAAKIFEGNHKGICYIPLLRLDLSCYDFCLINFDDENLAYLSTILLSNSNNEDDLLEKLRELALRSHGKYKERVKELINLMFDNL